MAPVLHKGRPAFDYCSRYQLFMLGWQMSRNGIRSLVIVLAISLVAWSATIIKILHVTGVFDG